MTKANPILELRGVSKSFGSGAGREDVLTDVNLSVAPGEFVAMVGFSGSGKSTLMKLLCGLELPSEGEALYHGAPITEPDPARALVFQNYSLAPWLTVHGNIKLAVDSVFARESARDREARIANTSRWSASAMRGTAGRRSCPAACVSGSPSPGRWPCSLRFCCWTSRFRRWTR